LIGLGIGKLNGYLEDTPRVAQTDTTQQQQVQTPPSVYQPTQPTQQAPSQPKEIVLQPVDEDDHIRGAKDPEITFFEFSDTECPYCKDFHQPMKQLLEKYADKVQLVYRHFPISRHPKAKKEAEAAECAGDQGKFWEYLDRIFEVTPSNDGLAVEELPKIAEYVGIKVSEFQKCLDSGKYTARVEDEINQAVAAGAEGTPYTVILTKDGKKTPLGGYVEYPTLEQIVTSKLGK